MADVVAIRFKADAGQAQKEIKGLGRGFTDMAGKAKKANADALLLAGAVTAVAVAAAAAGVAVLKSAAGVGLLGDEIAKTSRIVGVSAEQFQVLSFAAERSGVDMSAVTSGLKKLSKSMFDAQHGSKQIADTFTGMGIAITGADGKLRDSEDVFRDIADRIKKVGVNTQTTAELLTVGGRSFADLTNILLTGSDGLDDYERKLRSLNGIMSDELLAASEAFQDAMTDLDLAVKGLKFQMAEGLLPAMTNIINAMALGVSKASPFVALLDSIAGASARAAASLTKMLGSLPPPLLAALYAGKLAGGLTKGVAAGPDVPDLPGLAVRTFSAANEAPGAGTASAAAVANQTATAIDLTRILKDADAIQTENHMDALAERFMWDHDHEDRVRALKDKALEEERRRVEQQIEWAAQTRDAQTSNVASAFGAVAHFAALGQQAVEDSYFGQTKAGKIAAKVMFVTTKAAALAQAAIQTALGITNGLATPPAPLGAALAVAAGIAGAVQIGTIAATTIQGIADAGLPPGALRSAGLNNHTAFAIRNDEMVVDPKGTSEITAMLAMQRRQMEMGAMGSANQRPVVVVAELDGRRVSAGLDPHKTERLEDGHDYRRNVRVAGAR